MNIKKELFSMQDVGYKNFHSKLMPNINPDTVIGVRIPLIRKLAKNIKNNLETETFLKTLPHAYYEENNLHAFLICEIEDFDECIKKLNKFLPYIDNWATCDSLRPKSFKNNTENLLKEIENWLSSKHTYTVRFGIEMLMTYYLDKNFDEKFLKRVSKIKSSEYYINMMMAWYFATALAKQWDITFPYIKENKLPAWVHNKTIQKAVESYRITKEQKQILKGLRIK